MSARMWLVAALAALGLQACDREPPVTTVVPPQHSLPDDTILRPEAAASAPASAVAANASAPASAATAAASSAAVAADTSAPPTGVLGAGPAAAPASAPVPQAAASAPSPSASAAAPAAPQAGTGTAAETEMSHLFDRTPPAAAAASAPASASTVSSALPQVRAPGDPDGALRLAQRPLAVPVVGIAPSALSDTYEQSRGSHKHEAIDILAPAGTPVVAVDDGHIAKLFRSKPGGLTIYEFDPEGRLAYYYAHLQRYADGLREGMQVRRGELLGYVGSTGNADPGTPHLHFAVFRLDTPPRWWQGKPVNPYPALSRAQPAQVAGR